jgi:hypothetical protein
MFYVIFNYHLVRVPFPFREPWQSGAREFLAEEIINKQSADRRKGERL